MASAKRRVLFPNSKGGLPAGEVTIPELLKEQGYATAAIGKWHLGHLPQYLPANHGFDYYFGIPYSNDMDGTKRPPRAAMSMEPKTEWWNVPLMRNNEIIERPARQETITRGYTEESIRFIRENKSRHFFLYLPHTFPHVPLFASTRGRSSRGLYGDVVEELDWSVGQILQTLRDERLDENTLVIFTSDNGPWLIQKAAGGSAGLLRDGKGSTWEGGMRVPAIAWWPGKIKAGQVTRALASNLDFLPTCATLSGAPLPQDVELDGFDLSPVLLGKGDSARRNFIYFRDTIPFAYRKGEYKIHVTTQNGYGDKPVAHDPPLLFHLGHDPSEQLDLAKGHPDLARSLRAELDRHTARIKPGPNQLE